MKILLNKNKLIKFIKNEKNLGFAILPLCLIQNPKGLKTTKIIANLKCFYEKNHHLYNTLLRVLYRCQKVA